MAAVRSLLAALVLIAIGALGCSGLGGGYALGTDLRQLPRAGSAPLVDLLPARTVFAAAASNPEASWTALRDSPMLEALGDDLWRDVQALPVIERWRALQARLSELARVPLQGLEGLLEAPAIAAWVPAEGETPSGWIYAARIDESQSAAWAFVRALNAVRPSARDVRLTRERGLPVREISVGAGGQVAYALLSDRLVAGSDAALVSEAVDLALGRRRTPFDSKGPFADLERQAKAQGIAAAFAPPKALPLLPGVRSVQLVGPELQFGLAPALWQPGERRAQRAPGALVSLELSGLDVGALLAQVAQPPLPRDDLGPLFERLGALAPLVERGLFVQAVRWQSGIGVALDVARKAGSDKGFELAAAAVLASPKPAEQVDLASLRCSEDDDVCVALCPGAARLAWPGSFARAAGCPRFAPGSRGVGPSGEAAVELSLWAGGAKGGLTADVRGGRGRFEWVAP